MDFEVNNKWRSWTNYILEEWRRNDCSLLNFNFMEMGSCPGKVNYFFKLTVCVCPLYAYILYKINFHAYSIMAGNLKITLINEYDESRYEIARVGIFRSCFLFYIENSNSLWIFYNDLRNVPLVQAWFSFSRVTCSNRNIVFLILSK